MHTIRNYIMAESLEQAWELNQKGRNNIIIGGNLWLKMGRRNIINAIDLSSLGLDKIEEDEGGFRIGCMATLHDIETHEGLNKEFQNLFKEAVRHIVGVQFRNCATIGGSIFPKLGFSDVLTAFLACDTQVILYKKGEAVSMDISENGYYVTNELGEIHISGLPLGKYELKEVQELEGYVKNNKVYDIDLSFDHTDKIIYSKELDVLNKKTATEISKVDATNEKELEGAKLSLRDEDGNLVEEWTSTKDVHIIRGLVSGKKYILHEDLAPLGYATASDVTFTVNEDGSVTKVKMKDEITKVDISKVDATTGKEIEGAKLTLKDKETGEVVESWTSGKEPHRIEGLTVSKTYVLHEDLAPAGYNVASDVEFTISNTGEVQKVVMKDEAKPVVVKTGDDSNISFYVAMGMFALGLIVCFYAKRKYGEKNDK